MTSLELRVASRKGAARSMGACYWHSHPDSPIAEAAGGFAGALKITERIRPEIEHAISSRDLRVAYGLGIISTSQGCDPDVHQHATGLWPDVTEDEYTVRWIMTGVDWHRRGGDGGIAGELARMNARTEDDLSVADVEAMLNDEACGTVVAPTDVVGAVSAPMVLPQPMLDYLCRLVYLPKANYAADCAMALALGDPLPACEAAWAAGVRDKVCKYMRPTGRPTTRGSAR